MKYTSFIVLLISLLSLANCQSACLTDAQCNTDGGSDYCCAIAHTSDYSFLYAGCIPTSYDKTMDGDFTWDCITTSIECTANNDCAASECCGVKNDDAGNR